MKIKIKNIIIFITIAIIVIAVAFFFFKKKIKEDNLVSSNNSPSTSKSSNTNSKPKEESRLASEFLTLLLSVENIKLDDSIFSDIAFFSLHDSSIVLELESKEGRPNPFAPIGSEFNTPETSDILDLNTQKLPQDNE